MPELDRGPTDEGDDDASAHMPSNSFDGEDFLFHLYRGSELLQDNCVAEAKEELERALSMQPRDAEGQGLLGVVYFRLGLYPRAIQIYEELVRTVPDEITPKVNLSLCYLKTGQLAEARDTLEDVIHAVPDHKRAWGYLGLVFSRLGDHEKALASFERAGQEHMIRRMQQLIDADSEPPAPDASEHAEVRRAAADAMDDLEGDARRFSAAEVEEPAAPSRSGRWRAIEPGEQRLPEPRAPRLPALSITEAPPSAAEPTPSSALRSPATLARDVRLDAGAIGVASYGPATLVVRVHDAFAARIARVRALAPDARGFVAASLKRHARGRDLDEPLGGAASPIVRVDGAGRLVLGASPDHELTAVRLAEDLLYVREERLVGFDAALRFENGRLPAADADPTSIVQLGGAGIVVVESRRLHALDVVAGHPVLARSWDVLGWIGRLLPQPVAAPDAPGGAAGFVAFSGDGVLLLEG